MLQKILIYSADFHYNHQKLHYSNIFYETNTLKSL